MMNLKTTKHEDNRRTLIEWVNDLPIKCIKTIYVKDNSPLGCHYHNHKDEVFYLVKGKGVVTLTYPDKQERDWMFEEDCIFVPRGVIHTFVLEAGSILLEAATEVYKPEDEIRA
jgi:mannose-6-phosphate isomerase-like protein (cupin superfamily)